MIALAVDFLSGTYHATPWGRVMNDGVPEWPPSPWRLLRALVDAWQRGAPELSRERVDSVIGLLANQAPRFHLPAATSSAVMHVYPSPEGRSLPTVDAFVTVGGPVWVVWDVPADPQALSDLEELLRHVSYLGRSESWCEITVHDGEGLPVLNAFPRRGEVLQGIGQRLLVPAPSATVDDLMVETGKVYASRAIAPPGAVWVEYDVPPMRPVLQAPVKRKPPVFRAFRYTIIDPAKPPLQEAVRVGEATRRAVESLYGRQNDGAYSPTLGGRGEGKAGLRKGHRHAFYLSTDEDGDRRIDHISVWVPEGIAPRELLALSGLRRIRLGVGAGEVLKVTALGPATSWRDLPRSLVGPSREWVSHTPFVLGRHPKWRRGRWVDTLEQQVRGALDEHEIGVALVAEGIRDPAPLVGYRTRKRQGGGTGAGYRMRLCFEQELTGPLALGYGCHSGLGLFLPALSVQAARFDVREA